MELKHLRSFTAAAELRSFTRAAETLALTQAAISQHVAALEKQLGASLFDRGGRSVEPTELGKRFYVYARQILDLADEALRVCGGSPSPVGGELRIAASSVPSECLLPDLLKRYRERYPKVRELVDVSDSAKATHKVLSGEADVGLVGELPETGELRAESLGADELALYVAGDHPLAATGSIKAKAFCELPLAFREPGSGSRRCIERALAAAEISTAQLQIALECNSNDALQSAVERGTAAAFFSRRTVERAVEQGRLAPVKVEGVQPRRDLYLIFAAGRLPTPALRAFLGLVREI